MIELAIDAKRADIEKFDIRIDRSSGDLINPYSMNVQNYMLSLPKTNNNRKIFGFTDEINESYLFNSEQHTCEIYEDGIILISGNIVLLSVSNNFFYTRISEGVLEWITATSIKSLKNIDIIYEQTITASLISTSWTDNSTVKFLPVARDVYEKTEYSNEFAPVKILTYEDYHPFFHLDSVIKCAIESSGYKIASEFLDNEINNLYISGKYPEKDVYALKKQMDFFAVKLKDSTASANRYGVIYATQYRDNSVGNIVECADPTLTNQYNAFSNGGRFSLENDTPVFTPSQDVNMCFEYYFHYISDYKVLSATELHGISKVTLEEGSTREFTVTNKLSDSKNNYTSGKYIVCIFNYETADEYYISYYDRNNKNTTETLWESEYIISDITGVTDIKIYMYQFGKYSETKEWGLYNYLEYMEKTRDIEVYATVRSNPSLRKSGEKIYFNVITFAGAVENTAFTLKEGTSVKPVFYANPMEGSNITTADIFAYTQKQYVLIDAVKHLFNLRFLSDRINKTVYIETLVNFYTDEIIDWTEKTDESIEVMVEECNLDLPASMAYKYSGEDGTVSRWNIQNGETYASYTWTNPYWTTEDSTSESVNKFFSPTINEKGTFISAKSASVIKVGDRDNETDGNLNFSPKIIHYAGMKENREAEYWGYPSYRNNYPYACFMDDNEGVNLGFGQPGNTEGLFRYYKNNLQSSLAGKRITVFMNIGPVEMNSIIYPGAFGPDFRKRFKLSINGETVFARLEKINNYVPGRTGSTECVFIKN